VTNSFRELIEPQDFDEAMKSARHDISRATEANDIMRDAVAANIREDPDLERERRVAMLVSAMVDADQYDVLLMWAVLIIEQAEAKQHGS
jgi:hypothetical protein